MGTMARIPSQGEKPRRLQILAAGQTTTNPMLKIARVMMSSGTPTGPISTSRA
jgi:hypothetical protein